MTRAKAGWLAFRVTTSGLVVGYILWLADLPLFANIVWGLAAGCGLLPSAISLVRFFGLGILEVADVVGLLSMAGALVLGEYLAGAVIAFMVRAPEAWRTMSGQTPGSSFRR